MAENKLSKVQVGALIIVGIPAVLVLAYCGVWGLVFLIAHLNNLLGINKFM